ncbi:hypothetical protein SAG0136_05210 [Streptococcus agalactiae LMG 14747]|uniref:Uncharacterized protein n=1 Tax=Streptococcus agalactiae LMG 14747 TaxID=1154860 RepID=V6Z4V6_STRAG|nr:hypothetical protein SAG0136_05210 [Streptococcus agalactiae LMG 14747]
MCQCLNIPRSSYYYKAVVPVSEAQLEEMVKRIFLDSKSRYGARKIKKCLEAQSLNLSRRRIRRIMKRLNLVSVYQKAAFKLEFINQENFRSLEELTLKTKDYVHWWNHHRIHSTLNYQTPMTKRAIV